MDETYNELNLKFYQPTKVEEVILRETIQDYHSDDWGLTKDNVMLEMGAHTGTLSMYCAKKYGCKVYAFEPCLETYTKLLHNIKLNDLENLVIPSSLAITKDGRDIIVAQNPKNSGANNIYGTEGAPARSARLADTIAGIRSRGENIQVLLMDAEGAEFELLEDPEVVRGIPEFRGEFHARFGDIDALLISLRKVIPNAKPCMQYANLKKTFHKIYEKNTWKSKESHSGPGSELRHTTKIRTWLSPLIQAEAIKSVNDIGCGDFNWMKTIKLKTHYFGYDIVPELIAENQKKYGTRTYPTKDFFVANVIKDKLHVSELSIIRAVIYHLSYKNIWKLLKNVSKYTTRYILISNHAMCRENKDIYDGKFRMLNLVNPPFNFPTPLSVYPDSHVSDEKAEEMLLYKIETINDFLKERQNDEQDNNS